VVIYGSTKAEIKLREEREEFARDYGKAKFVCHGCGCGQIIAIGDLEFGLADDEKRDSLLESTSLPGESGLVNEEKVGLPHESTNLVGGNAV
jgi:hypothetical protein